MNLAVRKTSEGAVVSTPDGTTYLVTVSRFGLQRFSTNHPLPFGDYDENKCLKVIGVDLI